MLHLVRLPPLVYINIVRICTTNMCKRWFVRIILLTSACSSSSFSSLVIFLSLERGWIKRERERDRERESQRKKIINYNEHINYYNYSWLLFKLFKVSTFPVILLLCVYPMFTCTIQGCPIVNMVPKLAPEYIFWRQG